MALLSFLMGSNAVPGSVARRGWFFAFYAFLGFGVLAKGPVAILLPALSLFGYLFFRGRLNEWREWHPR
jgi:4-amino-4-deoxy-L-arabinose transferase-like glycosyltransferase